MPLRNVSINLGGNENQSRSRFFASENTINLYKSRQRTGRTQDGLLPWPGEKVFSTGASALQRGGWVMAEVLYVVNDQTLSSIAQDGTKTTIGTVTGGTRCSFADDGTNLIIRTGSTTYQYNGTTLSVVTDTDLEAGQSVTYINNQMIYQGIGNRFGVSDAGDPDSINGLNYASAEYEPSNIKQLYSFQERLYIACEKSVEVWWNNSSAGNPPFSRIQGSTSNVGVASAFSMANTEDYIYFVGDDDAIYRVSAYQPEQISPEAICKELRERITSDAIGMVCKLDGINFYIVQLPSSNYTLVYSEQTGEFIRLSTGTDLDAHLINDYYFVV